MAITVTQLNKYIKNILETDMSLSQISVRGEISNLKLHSSGHYYMTIKDENSSIGAVMFKTYTSKLKFTPENGMKIIATGKLSLYEKDGQYKVFMFSIKPDGIGDLHKEYEKLKAKLSEEGLFEQSHKKPIPRMPKKIGVITSPTGAAVRDIINVISRRFPMAEIIVYPVLVQGENSSLEIVKAIEYMNNKKTADVLIVGRGGGSIEDLWSFNCENVAYAIYNSQIPVISAVGHETDFTISDFVADLRAPTPSAAAELAVPSLEEINNNINLYYERFKSVTIQHLNLMRTIVSGFFLKSPMDCINQNRLAIDNYSQKIYVETNKSFYNYKNKIIKQNNNIKSINELLFQKKAKELYVSIAKLDALSPLKVLARGYSIIGNEKGILKSVKNTKPGEKIFVRLSDGKINCVVENIDKEK